jgi:hydroxymethylbilane synthase
MKLRIGTRKSRLALAQTALVQQRLKETDPHLETELVHITTQGDRELQRPLREIGGKGVFVSRIEYALQTGEIDLAVHSAKDLPVQLGNGLEIAGVLKRGNPCDVLVMPAGRELAQESVFTVGTGSLRRRRNLQRLFPHAVFTELRGNVDTRLEKLRRGEYDAVLLAAAGLERLGLHALPEFTYREFSPEEFLPAACQGIIALECRRDSQTSRLLQQIADRETMECFTAERNAIMLIGADCTMPMGAFSEIREGRICMTISADCLKFVSGEAETAQRFALVKELAEKL